MSLTPASSAVATAAPPVPVGHGSLPLVTGLFFMWGLITSLNDVLIPHLKAAFQLTYVQAMLVQFCFFGAYFLVSWPAGRLAQRLGLQRTMVVGLLLAAVGCVGFVPAGRMQAYAAFLAALFVLAAGITLLQVSANPYVTLLGDPAKASQRLTLTQAFNALGTTVGPALGAWLILHGEGGDAGSTAGPYLGLAATLGVLAVVMHRAPLPVPPAEQPGAAALTAPPVWRRASLLWGVGAIFLYVGGEVAIGSFLINALASPAVAGLSEQVAGGYLSLYWGGAMVGRFFGAAVMRHIRSAPLLAGHAVCVIALLLLAMAAGGRTAMWSLLAIGLFNSIMFPTIFALALHGLGARTGEGAGLLCMAIVGGALVPVVQGAVADHAGVLRSFVVPVLCYGYIAFYGWRTARRWPS